MVKEWTLEQYEIDKKKVYRINDAIHNTISLYYPLNLIIDCPEFQRLRDIKQLGPSTLVYPSAEHSRFTHSLGTYHLALDMMRYLRYVSLNAPTNSSSTESCIASFEISRADMLCVSIAALIHDLGHGPFSHTYEKFLHELDSHGFEHEAMSYTIFEMMRERYEDLKKALDEFLLENDFVFIKELINPPKKFVVNGEWQLKGRNQEKAFLYDIVSNKHTGVDIDKLDYFLRDSALTDVPIEFNRQTYDRIKFGTRVVYDKNYGYPRLVYREKISGDIYAVFNSRMKLHKNVYQHKTNMICATELIEILRLANNYLIFIDDDTGKECKLSNLFKNPSAFVKANDHILSMIVNLREPQDQDNNDLKRAKERLISLKSRKFPKFLYEFEIPNRQTETDESGMHIDTDKQKEKIRSGIIAHCEDKSIYMNLFIEVAEIHSGFGYGRSPTEKILFYNERTQSLDQPCRDDDILHNFSGRMYAYVYVTDGFFNRDKTAEILSAIKKYEVTIKRKRKFDDSDSQLDSSFNSSHSN